MKKRAFGYVIMCALTLIFTASSLPVKIGAEASSYSQTDRAEITVKAGENSYFYRDDILTPTNHLVYEQMERRSINAPFEEKMKTVDKCLAAGACIKEAIKYCFPLLPPFIDGIADNVRIKAVDSKITFRPDNSPMFVISRHKFGGELDTERLYRDIYLCLKRSKTAVIDSSIYSVPPNVTVEDNVKLTKRISSFSTDFSSSGEGRKNNIRLALKKISGAVINPGEEFSFNGRVGARTEKNGFSVAKIIVNGEYTDGVGGGVCQASTTLYNAALLAGMKITCVRNHTIAPSYVSPSLDAMVNSGSSDLKFVNPYGTPVFIKAVCSNNRAEVMFYGAEIDYEIKTYSHVISKTEVPPDKEVIDYERRFVPEYAESGEKTRVSYGHAGVKSEAYLRYYSADGALIKEEKIRSDSYVQTHGIIAVAP